MIAANGPIPGNLSLYAEEVACSKEQNTPGYYSSLNGAEVSNAQRSELYPCAHFAGSFTNASQNVVYAWRSQDKYQAPSYLNNRDPGELYLVGGDNPNINGSVAPGPYIAKVDATSGAQIWRTYLDNANTNDDWIATANLNILSNGNILFAFARQVVLLDGDTGLILKHNNLPSGPAGNDASFKHVTIAPDGIAIIKDQTRPGPGCSLQSSSAMFVCKGKQENSIMHAVDPNSTEILDSINITDVTTTPHTISIYKGKIAIYIAGDKSLYRFYWDPHTMKLSQDNSWIISNYLQPGQTTGDAPGILGDFIVVQTNGLRSNVSSNVVSVSQSDPKNIHSVTPFGSLKTGQQSWAPPKPAVDIENNFIISADALVNGLAGIRLDPSTGNMTVGWTAEDATWGLQTIIGPKDKRVLVVSNMNPNATNYGSNYTEQMIWRNMFTGDILAKSDFTEPMSKGSLITPGYGGRVYFMTDNDFIVYYVTTRDSIDLTGDNN
jgi:hypothetical protein